MDVASSSFASREEELVGFGNRSSDLTWATIDPPGFSSSEKSKIEHRREDRSTQIAHLFRASATISEGVVSPQVAFFVPLVSVNNFG
jgi:hypothetical protein